MADQVDNLVSQHELSLKKIIDDAKALTKKDEARRAQLVAQRDALNAQIHEIDAPTMSAVVQKASRELARLKRPHIR